MSLQWRQAIRDEQPNSFYEALPTNVGHEQETIAFTLDRVPGGWALAGVYERFNGRTHKHSEFQDDPKTTPR